MSYFKPMIGEGFYDRHEIQPDELLDLQIAVLDALEAAGHPSFESANNDRALRDSASDSEKKAWLAIYGPLTDVSI